MIGGSPRPFEPRFVSCASGSSISSLTISGTSAIVGSLYASSVVVRIGPSRGSCSRCSESVWPIPWMIPPSIWLDAPSGLITRPTSWIAAMRSTQTSPVSMSTATSATCTPKVSTCIPVGFGPRAPLPRICASSSTSTISLRRGASASVPRCSAISSICRRASAAAARTAGPIDGVVDEPAEIVAYGPRAESPSETVTCSSGMPSSSAAICAIAVRVPVPMSCIAVTTVARPSEPTRIHA